LALGGHMFVVCYIDRFLIIIKRILQQGSTLLRTK